MRHTMAIIGFGGMANYHYHSICDRIPDLFVKGVYDIREEACERAAEKGLVVYPTLDDLLADPEIELVLVATPNDVHKDLTIRSLRAGKHVICEKPVALNAAELEEMIAVSREMDLLFTVHQNRRWDRDYRMVRKVLEDGTIGKPYFIESRVQGSRGSMHGWRGHKINGGGMTYDWGIHLIDQLLDMIPAPVTAVDAHLVKLFSDEVDDNVKIFLHFENGVTGVCEFSTNCFINHPRWHVSCDNGTLVIDNWECSGRMVQLAGDGEMEWGDDIVYTAAGPTRTMAPRPRDTVRELPLPELSCDSFLTFYPNVLRAMEGKEELLVRPEQALRVMRVIDLIFEVDRVGHGLPCRI